MMRLSLKLEYKDKIKGDPVQIYNELESFVNKLGFSVAGRTFYMYLGENVQRHIFKQSPEVSNFLIDIKNSCFITNMYVQWEENLQKTKIDYSKNKNLDPELIARFLEITMSKKYTYSVIRFEINWFSIKSKVIISDKESDIRRFSNYIVPGVQLDFINGKCRLMEFIFDVSSINANTTDFSGVYKLIVERYGNNTNTYFKLASETEEELKRVTDAAKILEEEFGHIIDNLKTKYQKKLPYCMPLREVGSNLFSMSLICKNKDHYSPKAKDVELFFSDMQFVQLSKGGQWQELCFKDIGREGLQVNFVVKYHKTNNEIRGGLLEIQGNWFYLYLPSFISYSPESKKDYETGFQGIRDLYNDIISQLEIKKIELENKYDIKLNTYPQCTFLSQILCSNW